VGERPGDAEGVGDGGGPVVGDGQVTGAAGRVGELDAVAGRLEGGGDARAGVVDEVQDVLDGLGRGEVDGRVRAVAVGDGEGAGGREPLAAVEGGEEDGVELRQDPLAVHFAVGGAEDAEVRGGLGAVEGGDGEVPAGVGEVGQLDAVPVGGDFGADLVR